MTYEGHRPGRVDLHSHLVPGVDDGARTVEDVLEGVERMRERGVDRIVTTPHVDGSLTLDPDTFAARMAEMDRAFEPAWEAVRTRWPELEFSRANEVALDHPEPDLSHAALRLGGGSFVLVEWPRMQVPPGAVRALERLREQGVELLVAHPERYRNLAAGVESLGAWREAGAFLQVNYGSLVGAYRPEVQARAWELLARGWVDCLATDFHGRSHLRLFMREGERQLREHGVAQGPEGQAWDLLTRINPERILRGEPPLAVPAVPQGGTVWGRLASLFR
jgi:protein-tyrosine phosphatase